MLIGKEAVLKAFDLHNELGDPKLHWKITYATAAAQNSPIAFTPRTGGLTKTDSRALLEKWLNELQPGNYKIDFKESLEQTKNYNSALFEVPTNHSTATNSPAIGNLQQPAYNEYSDYVHKDKVMQMVKDQMEIERLRKDYEDMKALLSEREDNSLGNAIGKLLNEHGNILVPLVMQKITGSRAVGVAGFGAPQNLPQQENLQTTQTTETMSENTEKTAEEILDERAHTAISKLIAIENGSAENAVTLLEKLVLWIEKNPGTYAVLKPTILATT